MLDKLVWVSTWTSYSQLATFWSLTTAKWIQADEFVLPGYDWLCGCLGRKGLPKFILRYFLALEWVGFFQYSDFKRNDNSIRKWKTNNIKAHKCTQNQRHWGHQVRARVWGVCVVCVSTCACVRVWDNGGLRSGLTEGRSEVKWWL